MPLDPLLQAYVDGKRSEPRFSDMDVAAARASRAGARMQIWPEAAPCRAEDLLIPMAWGDCRARYYRPEQADGPLPLVILFHGGGFVVCDLDTHDGLARGISGGAHCAVLSVDYRLAPEARFPAQREDAIASVLWARGAARELNIDPDRIFLAGDSAGGHIAVTAALVLAERKTSLRLAGLALCYPVLDAPQTGHASYANFAEGFGLTRRDMLWFWGHYTAGANGPENITALPDHTLATCPPTYVLTAEYDVLRDEGEVFAKLLEQQGVDVTAQRTNGVNHNFLAFAKDLAKARGAMQGLCGWIKAQAAK